MSARPRVYDLALLLTALSIGSSGGFSAEKPPAPPVKVGQELMAFGRAGFGPSQMDWVEQVAVDSQGFVYAVDTDLDRLQRFSPEGRLETLVYPEHELEFLAFDRGGSLYAATDELLLRYDPATLTLLGEVELPEKHEICALAPRRGGGILVLRERGSEAEILVLENGKVTRSLTQPALRYPSDVIASPSLVEDRRGHFYIAESDEAIHELGPDGRYIRHFSSSGDEPGQFNYRIKSLTLDSLDQLWAGDHSGFNVFTLDGRFLRRFPDMDSKGAAINDRDELYTAQGERIVIYAVGRPVKPGVDEEEEATAAHRAREDAWAALETASRFAAEGSDRGKMKNATLVAVDPRGFVYSGDEELRRVTRFARTGELEGSFKLRKPKEPWTGLAVARGGTLYVAAAGRLFRYTTGGQLLGEVVHPEGPGFFHVAPRPDDGVIASWRNAERDDLVLVGKDGAIETTYSNALGGAVGEPVGELLVAMDGRRTIFAASPRLGAVFELSYEGEYRNRFGSPGDEPGQLSGRIAGLAADGQGELFVSDAKGVSVFASRDARFLRRLDAKGAGLAVSDDDEVFAANGTEVARLLP